MIKFALNIKLRYMLRKVLSLLFFIGFLVNGNLIAETCGGSEIIEIGGADGSFESCSTIASTFSFNANVTCGGWFNGQGTADSHQADNNFYNKLSTIGIYYLLKEVGLTNSEDDNIEELTKLYGIGLGYKEERVEKDLTLYISSVEKIKQAIELIELINKKS